MRLLWDIVRSPLGAWALCLGAGLVLAGLGLRATATEVSQPRALSTLPYAGSASCRACHPDHHQSWARTFHRTMTQEATPRAVAGDFNNTSYTYQGITSRFSREGDRFFMETLDANHQPRRYLIARTVGSRRVQQYVAREGDRYIRLPLAWNLQEQRWFHLNAGFLDPDDSDFNTHRALWDGNCIFCHNVKARPGYNWESRQFNSSVAELGIACEACHGPGAEHVARNANPLRRYYLHQTHQPDPTILSPTRLDPARQVQLCGHCHGQRLPQPIDRIRQFLSEGDPYTPGDDLSAYTTPLRVDSHLEGVDVSLRFWKDGTPRLSAYEYQSLLMTPDYQRGGLTCQRCHTAHGGDPRGMIPPERRGPAACQDCHAAIVTRAAEHSGHRAGGSGTDCYACHLPKITYGLMEVHPTHRISRPDPSRAWRYEMPEACTLCHTDRTARWAAEALSRQRGRPPPADLPTGPAFELAENVRALLSGDVVQRSVAAMALGDARGATPDPLARLWAVPFLLITMEDRYPAVRHFAFRSLKALVARAGPVRPELAASAESLPWFDPQAEAAERQRVLGQWRAWWAGLDKKGLARPDPSVPLDAAFQPIPERVEPLKRSQSEQTIHIGE